MEHEKNNAVEKMENIMRENSSNQAKIEKEKEQLREQSALEKLHKKEEKARLKAMLEREKTRRKQEQKELKKQKYLAKQETKKEKAKLKHKSKENRRGFGGWLAAVISLGVTTLVLAGILTYTFIMPSAEEMLLEQSYQRSFYDAVKEVDNIDLNLSKMLATNDNEARQTYLVDLAVNAELAENSVQNLPLEDESKFYTTKLINQIGDYSKYLNKKLINGENLSSKDIETLNNLYQMNLSLKEMLDKTAVDMNGDFTFMAIEKGNSANMFTEGFNKLENLSVDYPELIYDGPFSDGKEAREVKGLSGKVIDEANAKEIFIKTFSDYKLDMVKVVGKTMSQIECFNVQAEVNDDLLYAQISAKGGRLVMFSYAGSCRDTIIDGESAEQKASEFLTNNGFDNMKAVWINLAGNVYTINYAYEQNGIIVYPDLVKVRVCAETSMVIGLEATSYFTNHTTRSIVKPVLSEKQAQDKLSLGIRVDTKRLVVVPVGEQMERLCYEFSGEINDAKYYIYIDAVSGRQVEMFKVIKSTEGTLLI